jgi:hypothetical protein
MKLPIKLLCKVTGNDHPNITVAVNNKIVTPTINWVPDEHGNICIDFISNFESTNVLTLTVTALQENSSINLLEIVADNIRFGLVTFLCTTVDQKQSTQLNANGIIEVILHCPIWQYWCEKMNDFNYKDYPLGSAN